MLLSLVFPGLFSDSAIVSANLTGAVVTKSKVVPGTIIVKAEDKRPVGWFLDYVKAAKGIGHGQAVQEFEWKLNSDGSLSIWSRS